jgi:hypothetical protein
VTGKDFFTKLQKIFDKIGESVTALESRWFIFLSTTVIIMLCKAVGLHGLATLIGILYVMYFVTFLLDKR